MYIYDTLENISTELLHKAFLEAFSDYQVKMDLPFSKFQEMLKRRGYNPKASMGAFYNNALVGFLLNGIRSWDGNLTAYDTGTAVINSYRKQGITSNMFINSKELLKKIGVEQYLLEVIQSNTSAVELYKKQDFEILRDFQCFTLDKNNHNPISSYKVEHINMINESIWGDLIRFWDFKPSWQNSVDSINTIPDSFLYSIIRKDNKIAGYGIVDKKSGDIPQIAVDKNHRGKGIGKAIISDLISITESNKISVINVDSQCSSMEKFLINLEFKPFVSQYEMVLKL